MKKIKSFLELIFIKNFIGWFLLSFILFIIMTILSLCSIEIRLIIIGLIFTCGSLIYTWKQMIELYKSPDLDLYIMKDNNLFKEINLPLSMNSKSGIELLIKNTGAKIADKFSVLLAFEDVPEIDHWINKKGLKESKERRNNKEFFRIENRSGTEYYIFPNFSHRIGSISFKFKDNNITNYTLKIEYVLVANDMENKKGKLFLNFINIIDANNIR